MSTGNGGHIEHNTNRIRNENKNKNTKKLKKGKGEKTVVRVHIVGKEIEQEQVKESAIQGVRLRHKPNATPKLKGISRFILTECAIK